MTLCRACRLKFFSHERKRTSGPLQRPEHYFKGGTGSWLLLTVGQVAALLACLGAAAGAFYLAFSERGRSIGIPAFQVWAGGLLSVCLSLAMFVVFQRAKTLTSVTADQFAENDRLWAEIDTLRENVRQPSMPGDPLPPPTA
jgi:hypothetical protein